MRFHNDVKIVTRSRQYMWIQACCYWEITFVQYLYRINNEWLHLINFGMNDTVCRQDGCVLVGLWLTVNISAVIDDWLGEDWAIQRIQFNLKSKIRESQNGDEKYQTSFWPSNLYWTAWAVCLVKLCLIFSPGFDLIVLQCLLYDTTYHTLYYNREHINKGVIGT